MSKTPPPKRKRRKRTPRQCSRLMVHDAHNWSVGDKLHRCLGVQLMPKGDGGGSSGN